MAVSPGSRDADRRTPRLAKEMTKLGLSVKRKVPCGANTAALGKRVQQDPSGGFTGTEAKNELSRPLLGSTWRKRPVLSAYTNRPELGSTGKESTVERGS